MTINPVYIGLSSSERGRSIRSVPGTSKCVDSCWNPCTSVSSEQLPEGTCENCTCPRSSDTWLRAAPLPQVTVTLTPGIATLSPAGNVVRTVASTVPVCPWTAVPPRTAMKRVTVTPCFRIEMVHLHRDPASERAASGLIRVHHVQAHASSVRAGVLSDGGRWQHEGDAGPHARRARDLDGPAVRLHVAFHNRHSQAGAPRARGEIGLEDP
jgi:hypothetical protein